MHDVSNVFSEKSNVIPEGHFDIVPPSPTIEEPQMPKPNNPLQDYVLKVMRDNNLTYPDVEKLARRRGGTIGKSTIQQIAKGDTTNPGIFTLVELSWGLNRPIDEVITTTLGTLVPDPNAFDKSEFGNLWLMFRQLPTQEQRFVKRFLQMLDREIRRLLSGE